MATQAATVQITMPAMGESVTEGTVLEWLKQVGDAVTADEPLVEVSTDKVDAEVPSPASGTLVRILVGPDETVQVGAPLGEIEVGDAARRDPARPASPTPPPRPPATAPGRPPEARAGGGRLPGDGRLRGRGHGARVAQAGGRPGGRGRHPGGDLHRQGGRRAALAGGRHAQRDPGAGRRDGRGGHHSVPDRRGRGRRPGRARTGGSRGGAQGHRPRRGRPRAGRPAWPRRWPPGWRAPTGWTCRASAEAARAGA